MQSSISDPLGDPYHCRINCVFQIKEPNHKKYKREIWNYNIVNYGELNQCISTAPWHIMDTFDNINDSCYAFTDLYMSLILEHIPSKIVNLNPLISMDHNGRQNIFQNQGQNAQNMENKQNP